MCRPLHVGVHGYSEPEFAPLASKSLGYGENARGEAEIELIYNWDQQGSCDLGSAFGHLALRVPDVAAACEVVRKGGGRVIAFVEASNACKIELIERK